VQVLSALTVCAPCGGTILTVVVTCSLQAHRIRVEAERKAAALAKEHAERAAVRRRVVECMPLLQYFWPC